MGQGRPRLFAQVLAVFTLGFSILSAVSLVSLRTFDAARAARDSARRAAATREAVAESLSVLKDIESRARGYALTGDGDYRRAHEDAEAALDGKLVRLHVFVREGPETEELLVRMIDAMRARAALSHRLAREGRTLEPARRLRLMKDGHDAMERARAAGAELIRRETELEFDHAERSEALSRRARAAIRVSLLVAFLLFAGAAEAIRRAFAERERVERLKGEVISLASHELRTPLTVVSGAMKLLLEQDGPKIEAEGRELVEIGLRNARHMLRVIDDYLDLASIESGGAKLESVAIDLDRIAAESVASMKHYAVERGLRYALRTGPARALARGDAEAAGAVLANLLSNAAKFSPDGGEVEVTVEPRGERVRVGVRDHGPGVRKEFAERIFGRFARDATAAGAAKGAGLGLSISRALIERMGGSIWFETVEGEGTAFFFELPAAPAA